MNEKTSKSNKYIYSTHESCRKKSKTQATVCEIDKEGNKMVKNKIYKMKPRKIEGLFL